MLTDFITALDEEQLIHQIKRTPGLIQNRGAYATIGKRTQIEHPCKVEYHGDHRCMSGYFKDMHFYTGNETVIHKIALPYTGEKS